MSKKPANKLTVEKLRSRLRLIQNACNSYDQLKITSNEQTKCISVQRLDLLEEEKEIPIKYLFSSSNYKC